MWQFKSAESLVLSLMLAMTMHADDCSAQSASLGVIQSNIANGQFAQAQQNIASLLIHASANEKSKLFFEQERMRRIKLDFPYDDVQIKQQIAQHIPSATASEIALWTDDRRLESMLIDNQRRYFHRAVKNLFYIDASLLARKNSATRLPTDSILYLANPLHEKWLNAISENTSSYLDSHTFKVNHQIIVNADAVPAGEMVRAWIPYPREIAGQQQHIKLIASSPSNAFIAPVSALQRTAYLEQKAIKGKATVFNIEYELTTQTLATRFDEQKINRIQLMNTELSDHLQERAPHIVFTPELRAFSKQIVGSETNVYKITQKLFEAVSAKPWAVAREYSTLYNISNHALQSKHADCGEKAMLLISLLRLNGIPAKWQSGWQLSPDGEFDSMHDWGMFYLAPYGWLPMDPTHGVLQSDNKWVQWFYLGSLDGYRIAFNDDWGQEFVPSKQHLRSETVDSQRGEVEWQGGNVYFDQWDYRVTWQQKN